MHNTKRYFLHHLRSVLPRLAVFTIIAVLITVMTANGEHLKYAPDHSGSAYYILTIIIGFLATVLPMFEFSVFNNKRNLDTLFSLPIKRSSLSVVHIAVGFIQMFTVYTLSTVSLYVAHLDFASYYDFSYLIPYYFSILGLGTIAYFIFTFIFTRANSTLDGIVFCVFWMFNVYTVYSLLDNIFNFKTYISSSLMIYTPMNNVTTYFQYLTEMEERWIENATLRDIYFNTSDHIVFASWGVAGLVSLVAMLLTFGKKKVECVGEISDSIFGYALNIPLYLVCLTGLFDDVTATVWLTICAVIGYFIYRRGFKLKKADLISIIISFILLCVFNTTETLI